MSRLWDAEMICYPAASGRQVVILTDPVLNHFARYRQYRIFDREAGGRLYATFDRGDIKVEVATGPCVLDRRNLTSFVPNRVVAKVEIKSQFRAGRHYIGDWHTHLEATPRPSGLDRQSMAEMFRQSDHELAGFLMVIVGTEEGPEGLYVAISDQNGLSPLWPKPSTR